MQIGTGFSVVEVGYLVSLRIHPYTQYSLKKNGADKLKPHFYGPYNIFRRVGEVFYELELPEGRKNHNVFHVSFLKKVVGQNVMTSSTLPPLDEEGKLILIPEDILHVKERKLRKRVIWECLVRWKESPIEDATWEREQVLHHPGLQLLKDKQFRVGRTIMSLFA